MRTVRADLIAMVAEEYVVIDNKWVKSTFIYTATTRFKVKETRAQVLKLLKWDPVREVKQHERKKT